MAVVLHEGRDSVIGSTDVLGTVLAVSGSVWHCNWHPRESVVIVHVVVP